MTIDKWLMTSIFAYQKPHPEEDRLVYIKKVPHHLFLFIDPLYDHIHRH